MRPPLNDVNTEQGLVNLGSIPGLSPVASFNVAGIENLLQTKGFVCYHYLHALNPDRETLTSGISPNTKGAAHRGVLYYAARSLKAIPQNFQINDRLTIQGIWGVGSVLLNITGNYIDGEKEQTHVRNRDLIVFPTLTTMTEQLIEYNPNGPQKLNYKVKGVHFLADKGMNIYQIDRDFILQDGNIQWVDGGLKPSYINGKGAILTVVYYYTPIYIVQNLPHALRVIPSNVTGNAAQPRNAVYAPQLLVAKPSTLAEESEIIDWSELPPFPDYRDSMNTTGGSY